MTEPRIVDEPPLEGLQQRAARSVAILTGLDLPAALTVVRGDRHDLYDGSRGAWMEFDEDTLAGEVRAVVADHLAWDQPAKGWNVGSLLSAMDAGIAGADGDLVRLRLLDDREALTGDGYWSDIELRGHDGMMESLATGLAANCPDPLLVADAIARWCPRHPDSPAP